MSIDYGDKLSQHNTSKKSSYIIREKSLSYKYYPKLFGQMSKSFGKSSNYGTV